MADPCLPKSILYMYKINDSLKKVVFEPLEYFLSFIQEKFNFDNNFVDRYQLTWSPIIIVEEEYFNTRNNFKGSSRYSYRKQFLTGRI